MSTSTTPAKPLSIGAIKLDIPVVLAPMAGITNTAFRRLCREYGGGLFVSEMITSRALVERTPGSMRLIGHHESESTRSIQLYGVDPTTVARAVSMLVDEDRADHIDLNFGCPVPKVTRKGGGAALPWKTDLFRDIVEGAVASAGNIPVTVKMRKGIDADHLTFLEAARIAAGAGVSSIALHGRTASEFYSGKADWDAIAELKQAVSDVPVLGNGDIWSGDDAVRMMDQTGCDGVVVCDMPLAADTGRVARFAQVGCQCGCFWSHRIFRLGGTHGCKRGFLLIQHLEHARASAVLPGEKGGTRRRALRIGIRLREQHPLRRETIQVRRLQVFVAVTTQRIPSHVIGEDVEDIRLAHRSLGGVGLHRK